MNRTLCILLALSAIRFVNAQTAPTPPFVTFGGDKAAWTVDISYRPPPGDKKSSATPPDTSNSAKRDPNAHAVKVEAVRTGTISRYHITWSDGSVTEEWLTPKYLFPQDHLSGESGILYRPGLRKTFRYPQFDETQFGWVKQNAFAGKQNYKGKECFNYKSMVTVLHMDADDAEDVQVAPASYQAWIDTNTNLPVAFDDGQLQILYVYTFLPPPVETLVLPPKFQELVTQYERAVARPILLGNPPPPPP